jgi:hypothetical protein
MSGDHAHTNTHTHDWRDPHAAPGWASVLDIGDDVGAVIARLTDDTPSGELMACRRGDPAAHFHTGVHLRAVGSRDDSGNAWIAVFPEVVAGPYSLLTDDGVEHTPFEVTGGQVTSLDLTVAGPGVLRETLLSDM